MLILLVDNVAGVGYAEPLDQHQQGAPGEDFRNSGCNKNLPKRSLR